MELIWENFFFRIPSGSQVAVQNMRNLPHFCMHHDTVRCPWHSARTSAGIGMTSNIKAFTISTATMHEPSASDVCRESYKHLNEPHTKTSIFSQFSEHPLVKCPLSNAWFTEWDKIWCVWLPRTCPTTWYQLPKIKCRDPLCWVLSETKIDS